MAGLAQPVCVTNTVGEVQSVRPSVDPGPWLGSGVKQHLREAEEALCTASGVASGGGPWEALSFGPKVFAHALGNTWTSAHGILRVHLLAQWPRPITLHR